MIVNGTTYNDRTPAGVINTLERARETGTRLRILYGDKHTGRSWHDIEVGRIGRSTGSIKIPLVIANRRSTGGGGLLDDCIVQIREARGGGLLWRHPQFSPLGIYCVQIGQIPGLQWEVAVEGQVLAWFATEAKARRWVRDRS